MKEVVCKSCGSNDLYKENGFYICRYCGTKFLIASDEIAVKESVINLNDDVAKLLQRCKEQPERAKKCAERILEIDPNNEEAKRILGLNKSNSNGCYIATAVYGSYDCPEVWTLRRYRDTILTATWHGRSFIHLYYLLSPTFVKLFGHTKWFMDLCKPKLDKFVKQLNENGINCTPYNDIS